MMVTYRPARKRRRAKRKRPRKSSVNDRHCPLPRKTVCRPCGGMFDQPETNSALGALRTRHVKLLHWRHSTRLTRHPRSRPGVCALHPCVGGRTNRVPRTAAADGLLAARIGERARWEVLIGCAVAGSPEMDVYARGAFVRSLMNNGIVCCADGTRRTIHRLTG